ncbi:MAG: type II toxin-antitoxin system VapB family antitoxin [Deltaproteobacteria bacterium]|nr:type II toxin-antitoxin system VapB family antitoxin [Deltaproteobacteria bacterium]
MRTTLDLPEDLVKQATKLSKKKTKTETITTALSEYIRLKKLEKLAQAAGNVLLDPHHDWSAARHKR